jgi:hypothetical protein
MMGLTRAAIHRFGHYLINNGLDYIKYGMVVVAASTAIILIVESTD